MSNVLNPGEDRRRQAVVLLGAAAATVTVTALGQTPAAHADDFSTLTADISEIYSFANNSFTDGITALEGGEVTGLSEIVTGLDDGLLGPELQFGLGRLDLLTGTPIVTPGLFSIELPAEDFSAVLAANEILPGQVSEALQLGFNQLSDGNINGLADFIAVAEAVLVGDPELFGLGAVYSLLGF